jgi:hypothetical protein
MTISRLPIQLLLEFSDAFFPFSLYHHAIIQPPIRLMRFRSHPIDSTQTMVHNSSLCLYLSHIDNTSNAIALFHSLESLIDTSQVLAVGNELIDLELSIHVISDQVWQLRTAFDASKCTSLPHSSSDQLKCYSRISIFLL